MPTTTTTETSPTGAYSLMQTKKASGKQASAMACASTAKGLSGVPGELFTNTVLYSLQPDAHWHTSRWGGSQIVRFNSAGNVDFKILFPAVLNVTSCCFGGENCQTCYEYISFSSRCQARTTINFLSPLLIAGHLEEMPVDKKNTQSLGICFGSI